MNDPLPIQDLPEYLKTHRNAPEHGSPVIAMGQIVAPRTNWLKITSIATAACLLLAISGYTVFNVVSPKDITVVIAANDTNPAFIANMVSVAGGKVVSVTQTENDTYEVKLSLRKNTKSFLDWLRKNKDVKRVELGE